VQRLHRDDVDYRPLADAGVVSPVIMNVRAGDRSELLQQFRGLALGSLAGAEPPLPSAA
jgi:hypothetical protein